MKHRMLPVLLLFSAAVWLAGCSMTLPCNEPGSEAEFLAHEDDFEIIGPVTGEAHGTTIFLIPIDGNAGYEEAYNDALRKSGGDALIDVRSDVTFTCFLPPLCEAWTTTLRGTAIKHR